MRNHCRKGMSYLRQFSVFPSSLTKIFSLRSVQSKVGYISVLAY